MTAEVVPQRRGAVGDIVRLSLFDLPLLDELRTYCYEHRIEEIPAFLVA